MAPLNLIHHPTLLLFTAIMFPVLFSGCGGNSEAETRIGEGVSAAEGEVIPLPPREFRAAWVATVDNIDWPSSPTLTVDAQKSEAVAILNRLQALNMNAVIFQVRPQADALYQSSHEPWSYYLTGEQGKAPSPLYDPLQFWIDEAHKRGIHLHAWFNPYRANHKANRGPISNSSIVKQNPELVVKLGDEGYWWMVPTERESKVRSTNVIMDVVSRYDIDGVHFDDYFYPYPAYHKGQDFPDNTSYQIYTESGGKLNRGDWRRDAVNQFIRELGPKIKAEKSHVEFGISPFGIWRPGHPKNVIGMDQYSVLYADARLWLHQGWVDYFMPQLYWPISAKNQSFSELLVWWKEQNLKARHLWPGLSIAGAGESEKATELVNQVKFTRDLTPDSSGACLFSMKHLMNKEFQGAIALKQGLWAEQALIPSSPWVDNTPPAPPTVDLFSNREEILLTRFKPAGEEAVFQFILNEKRNSKWMPAKIVPGVYRSYEVKEGVEGIAVRSVDRLRNVSAPVVVEISR